ncbi:MAG: AAA family ATPase [Dehalococcoidales bacterium]|nr:AAA family ATPase [Dehalococcoidales bacterium]
MNRLPEMVQALLQPEIYPEPTKRVRLEQTQMSFVFLGDKYVYKIKKAVNLGYLDYTTLEKRKFFCEKEIELNQRLSTDVYIGVIPITKKDKKYAIGGTGEIVEYAVKMRKLPGERMLDVLLKENSVTDEMMPRLAARMADFHSKAATNSRINIFGSVDSIAHNNEENLSQMGKYIGRTLSRRQYQRIANFTRNFIKDNTPLFEKRIKENRIRDCHGDLHAAHICFENGLIIYDCIEFNDRFRYCDVASEVAFLAMDLDHNGRADLARSFVKSYIVSSGDADMIKLLHFYKCYRACIRGKVSCFKLDDPYITPEQRQEAEQAATSYFDLACSYVNSTPTLFITAGLTGSGKSALAEALAKRLGLVVLSSDITRKKLANIWVKEHCFEKYNTGIYSPEFSRKTYDTLFEEAKKVLSDGESVIIDAAFIKAAGRVTAKELAEEIKAKFFILECTLDEETAKGRLERRLKETSVSDGRWEVYQIQKSLFESVVEVPPRNRVIIDNNNPIEENVKKVLDVLDNISNDTGC